LTDIEPYEKLFRDCLTGSLDQVRLDVKQLEEQPAPVLLQPLATLAASKGHAEILQFCLDKGAVFDIHLDRAAYDGASNPVMLDTLLAANWQNLQHSKSTRNDLVRCAASKDVKMLIWLLDHGAKVSRETIKLAGLARTPVPTMALLIEKCGAAALTDSCALQHAAGRGERDMVEFLLHVGADVEEMPKMMGDIREPGPFTALYEAVRGQHTEVVQLLLDHGAKADTVYGRHVGPNETPLQAARRLGNSQIVGLLEQRSRQS
jgi:Ankyrin repeats (3 copies)